MKDFLATYLLQTGSYLGETIVRSLNGKCVRTENPVGWAVSLDGERIDVFQMALESIFMLNRFNELVEKLTTARKREDSEDQPPRETLDALRQPTGIPVAVYKWPLDHLISGLAYTTEAISKRTLGSSELYLRGSEGGSVDSLILNLQRALNITVNSIFD